MRSAPAFSFFVVACLGACAAGCSAYSLREPSTPPLDALGAPPPAAARICVVRTSVLAAAVTFPTRDNGRLVGATRGPGHFCWLAEPGRHEITVESDQVDSATLRADPAKVYFLRQRVSNVLGVVTCEPQWIDQDEARGAIASTSYEILSGVPGEEAPPEQPPFVKAMRE